MAKEVVAQEEAISLPIDRVRILKLATVSGGVFNMDAWDGQDEVEKLRSPISLCSLHLVYPVHPC